MWCRVSENYLIFGILPDRGFLSASLGEWEIGGEWTFHNMPPPARTSFGQKLRFGELAGTCGWWETVRLRDTTIRRRPS